MSGEPHPPHHLWLDAIAIILWAVMLAALFVLAALIHGWG
jgi:hypothetical protein